MDVAPALSAVRERIAAAALRSERTPGDIRLVLVTKTIPAERIREAIAFGQIELGENKVQEGRRKAQQLAGSGARWSMIGHLQRNKIKEALEFADEVQSLDRLRLAEALDRRLQHLGKSLNVLVQVNTSGEASKFGLDPCGVGTFLREVRSCDALHVRGFMTLATFTADEGEVRRCFRLLRAIRDRARDDGWNLPELSMGMSGDFEWAIEEGATIVRVGQAVFGTRALPDSHYWPGAAGAV